MKLFEEAVDFKSIVERLTDSMFQSGLITDKNEGGVAQLLAETFAREMATFYEILNKAHTAGYLDTATGGALDSVVAVLGVGRAAPGLLRGQVEFSCSTPAPQDIVIPAGAKISGPPLPDGSEVPPMETVEQARIPAGGRSVRVAVQEVSKAERSKRKRLPTGALSIMPRPLLGVDKVTNPDPIIQGEQKESDEHLRARAGSVLREAQKGTVEAIKAAVRSLGIEKVKVIEDPDWPGWLEVQMSDPELERDLNRQRSAENAVHNMKAAGINAKMIYLRSVYCHLIVTIETENDEMEADAFDKLAQSLKQDITAFIKSLEPGTSISKNKLRAVMLGHPMINSVVKIEMKMFVLEAPDLERNVTEDRDKNTGFWFIGPLENATIDPKRWPVTLVQKRPSKAHLNLMVTVYKTNQNIDDVRRKVRKAFEDYVRERRPEGDENVLLAHKDLVAKLRKEAPVIDLRPTWIVHQDDGQVEDLNENNEAQLKIDEKLSLGRIDITLAVYCEVDVTVELTEDSHMEDDTFDELARKLEKEVTVFINNLGPGTSIAEGKLKAVLLNDSRVKEAILKVNFFLRTSPESEEDVTQDRKRAGIWHIDPLECAAVYPDRWPVTVKRKDTG
jgi:hypothetical protein